MTTRTTPTESSSRARFSRQLSVRARLTLVIALLTATAMTSAGLIVYALESARIEREVTRQLDQEIMELRQLQSRGVDPETGQPFASAQRLLRVFLERNVPDDDEMLVAYVPGMQPERSANRYGEEVLRDPVYEAVLDQLRDVGGTEKLQSEQFGQVWVTVIPVLTRNDTEPGGNLAILNFLDDEHIELNATMRTYAIVALLSLGLICLLAALQSGRLLAPLRTLRETANDITATDLSRRIAEVGNDDITALTRTINDMLDRIESGFEVQRQFLDDAGHELRTPLTVLSGHLELIDPHDPVEVAEVRQLLLDETDRMSRLVGDLILLAKSRRPDFITTSRCELSALTRGIQGKARALGDRAWDFSEVGHGEVVVDDQRITQAMLQLVDNAVKHTEDDDAIAIGSSLDGDALRLWVRDTGDGIPEADHDHIFERFRRSGVRPGDEGFGLGLSIVKAIALAHGGRVDVAANHPRGAVLTLSLPRHPAPLEDPWPAS